MDWARAVSAWSLIFAAPHFYWSTGGRRDGLVDRPCRYSSGTSAICGDFRAQEGRIAEETGIAARWPRRCACR